MDDIKAPSPRAVTSATSSLQGVDRRSTNDVTSRTFAYKTRTSVSNSPNLRSNFSLAAASSSNMEDFECFMLLARSSISVFGAQRCRVNAIRALAFTSPACRAATRSGRETLGNGVTGVARRNEAGVAAETICGLGIDEGSRIGDVETHSILRALASVRARCAPE